MLTRLQPPVQGAQDGGFAHSHIHVLQADQRRCHCKKGRIFARCGSCLDFSVALSPIAFSIFSKKKLESVAASGILTYLFPHSF
jgi:hypothetical protein